MKSSGRYARKVSPIERLSLALNEVCHYDVDLIIEGVGEISAEQLQSAVVTAAQVNPGCRVRLRGCLGFSKWVDSGVAPVVHVIEAPDWDGRSQRAADFLEKRFEPLRNGPMCDVVLVRGALTRIVFRAVHGAIDGRGQMHWAQEVFRVLRGERPLGAPCTMREIDIMEKHQQNVPGIDPYRSDKSADLPVLPPGEWHGLPLRYSWRNVRINRNISNPMAKMAVFLASYARRAATGSVSFTVPIDLRALREPVLSTGNLTGFINIPVHVGDTPKIIMQKLSQRIRDFADCRIAPEIKSLPWFPLFFIKNEVIKSIDRTMSGAAPSSPSGGLVSMGSLKLEEFSCPGFSATVIIGIPGFVGNLNVVIFNLCDHTSVTFAAPQSFNRNGELDKLAADFKMQYDQTEQLARVGV